MSTSRAQFWIKTSVLSAAVVGAMMLSGCGKKEAETVTLNIGFQKYGILPIVKERGTLETALKAQNVQVKWVEFPAGPQLLEGLNVGSVVFGEAGEAPPIFAQAANSNLVYIANQPAAPKAEALMITHQVFSSSNHTCRNLMFSGRKEGIPNDPCIDCTSFKRSTCI